MTGGTLKTVKEVMPTVMASWYAKTTYASRPTPYVIEMNEMIQVGQIYGTEKEPNPKAGRVYSREGIAPTLDAMRGRNTMPKIEENVRIRKLTPRECFRLQGFPDYLFERAAFVNSDSQLYKQAGNSVTVNVIVAIAEKLKEKNGN